MTIVPMGNGMTSGSGRGLKVQANWLYAVSFLVFAVLAVMVRPFETENFSLYLLPVVGCAMAGALVGIIWVWAYSNLPTDGTFLRRFILGGAAVDILFNWLPSRLNPDVYGPLSAALMHGVANIGMLIAAVGAGLLVGRGLQKPNYLVVAATVGAVTDVFSVYGGPSKHILSSEMIFPYISFHWGMIGTGGINEAVGAGDFIFLALYFYGARKFGLNEIRTLAAMMIAVICGLVVTYFATINGLQGVPALPFFSVALLLTHRKALRQKMAAMEANVAV